MSPQIRLVTSPLPKLDHFFTVLVVAHRSEIFNDILMWLKQNAKRTSVDMIALMLAGSSVKMRPVPNMRISTVRPGTASSQLLTSSKKVNLKNRYKEYTAKSIPAAQLVSIVQRLYRCEYQPKGALKGTKGGGEPKSRSLLSRRDFAPQSKT